MESVIVQTAAGPGGEAPRSWTLGPGDALRFGRADSGPGVDVGLADPSVSRLAGEIHATEDFWLLTNFAREQTYVVENPEGGGEFVKVGPGRMRAPIPFEFSRLMVPVAAGTADLLVFAPAHGFLGPDGPRDGESTSSSFSLDERAKYFLVLVALCEPRLRDPSSASVPSDRAVAERLAEAEGCADLTPGAVGFHVDYLAERKLRVRARERSGPGDHAERLEHKREALVSIALRFDLIRGTHLSLLP
ncbi:MAG: serine/threonine protein kinase [Solirubrobacteraceae bacterium]